MQQMDLQSIYFNRCKTSPAIPDILIEWSVAPNFPLSCSHQTNIVMTQFSDF